MIRHDLRLIAIFDLIDKLNPTSFNPKDALILKIFDRKAAKIQYAVGIISLSWYNLPVDAFC